MKSKNLDRTFLAVGAGLILVAFVGMSVRRFAFAYGDMRVFDWIALNSILTAVGLSMLIGVGIAKLVRRFRRR